MAEFEIIGGRVTSLRYTLDTRPPNVSNGTPPMRQLAHFAVEGRMVAYSDVQPMFVREGDVVWVAGRWDDDGVFRAVAYRDLTLEVEGCRDTRLWYARGRLLPVLTLIVVGLTLGSLVAGHGDVPELLGDITRRPALLLGVSGGAVLWLLLVFGTWIGCRRKAGEPRRALRALCDATSTISRADRRRRRE